MLINSPIIGRRLRYKLRLSIVVVSLVDCRQKTYLWTTRHEWLAKSGEILHDLCKFLCFLDCLKSRATHQPSRASRFTPHPSQDGRRCQPNDKIIRDSLKRALLNFANNKRAT